jgi:hypothetical protein
MVAGYPAVPPGYAPASLPQQFAPAGRATIVYVPYPMGEKRPSRGYAEPASWAPPPAPLSEYDGREYAELDEFPGTRRRSGTIFGDAPGTPTFTPELKPARTGLDRWSVSSWALMRQTDPLLAASSGGVSQPVSLASSGTLGGSQAGIRVAYNFSRAIAANLRVSAPIDRQKAAGEAALGISWRPLAKVPLRFIAERRQALGSGGGRSDFALLAEGGVYGQPMPWGAQLEGYAQAGVVGIRDRDLFADGGFAVTRPLLRRFAIGGGAWGGIQPGLSRLDVGPRVSMRIFPRIQAHVDYRLRLLGNAAPGSGPAVTLAGDF